MRFWRDFSKAIEDTANSVTWSDDSLKSLMSDMTGRIEVKARLMLLARGSLYAGLAPRCARISRRGIFYR